MAEKKFGWKKFGRKKNLAEKNMAEKILADVLPATPTQYTTAASSSFVKKLHKNSFYAHTHAQFDSNSI